MIERSKYKKLRKAVQIQIEEQADRGVVVVTKARSRDISGLHQNEIQEAWPHIVREFGLVDDGTGTSTWTLLGKGLMQNLDRAFPTKHGDKETNHV